jgi:hypothetical protein
MNLNHSAASMQKFAGIEVRGYMDDVKGFGGGELFGGGNILTIIIILFLVMFLFGGKGGFRLFGED